MTPNLLFVVFDTARADAFEPWGAPAGASPTVADLASRGTAFPCAIATSNWTLPSHASMFTGSLPAGLGLTMTEKETGWPGANVRHLIAANAHRTLAEVLRRRGYSTRGISANPFVHRVNGFDTGFEEFLGIQGVPRRSPERSLRSRAVWLMDAWRASGDDGAADAMKIMSRWAREHDRSPFFWFVNLMECHSPYLPPRPYNDLPGSERLLAARDAHRYLRPGAMYRACVGDLEVDEAALVRMRHLYAQAIRLMDDWLGRVLELLAESGLLQDTFVVVTSDHGENLGENNLMGHVLSMDDRLIRTPLVISGPDTPAPSDLVSLAELPAMLAPLLGLEDHPWTDDVRPHGFAVSQVAGGFLAAGDRLAKAWGVPAAAIRRIASPITAATDGRFKLVRASDHEQLFDLVTDNLESRPLTSDQGGAAGAPLPGLRAAIDAAETMTPAGLPTGLSPRDGETAELERRLRQLGYL